MSECIEAAKSGELHTLKRLCIERGFEIINTSDEKNEGYFPLYWAACKGHVEVCRFLLSQGAQPDKRLHTGSTALHAAADRGQLECAGQLVKSGCDVNVQNYNNFDTPLHLAAYRGYLDVCKLLAENSASLTLKNTHGKSPYDEALSQNHTEIAQYLYDCWQQKSHPQTTAFVRNKGNEPVTYKRTASYPCVGVSRLRRAITQVHDKQEHRRSSDLDWQTVSAIAYQADKYNTNKEVKGFQQRANSPTENSNNYPKTISFKDTEQQEIFFPVSNSTGFRCTELPAKEMETSIDQPIQGEDGLNYRHSSGQTSEKRLFLENKEVLSATMPTNHGTVSKNDDSLRKNLGKSTGHIRNAVSAITSDDSCKKQPGYHNVPVKPLLYVASSESESSLTNKPLKNNASSQNSHFHMKNHIAPKSNEVSVGDYIISLETRVTNQSDRITFLENKNAQLWQECEDLRSSKVNAQAIVKQNHKLTEQVQVLLHEIDELRKLLQSSEGRSRYLAKQLFRYQHLVELNNNQAQPLPVQVAVSGYPKMDPAQEHTSKSVGLESELEQEGKPRKQQSHRRKRTASKSSSSSSPRSRSPSSYSDGSSPKASYMPLLEAIRPVFQGAGQGFLMSMTDSLRQKLLETLPKPHDVCLDSPGKRWQVGEDFVILDERPINEVTPGRLEGSCSLVYRILHQGEIYILKMMVNLVNLTSGGHGEGRSFPLYLFQQFSAEYTIPCALPSHRNVIPVLHHFNGATLDFHGALEKLLPPGFDVPIDMANETSFIVLPQYSTTLGRLVEKKKEISRASQLSAICDVVPLPEEFVSQKLLEVLSAVNHLNQNNIVHRDIKADNIFLDSTLSAVLGDFGMARTLRSSDGNPIPFVEKGQVLAGNSLAWAPELIQWHSQGPSTQTELQMYLGDIYASSDVYAIGVMFISILSTNTSAVEWSGDTLSSQVSPGLRYILQSMVAPQSHRPTANKALTLVGIHLFGPSTGEVVTEEDCHTWLQAKMMKLLVCHSDSRCHTVKATLTVESSITRNRDLLEREFLSGVRSKELFQCYQEYHAALTDETTKL